jgi:hypothetical protein
MYKHTENYLNRIIPDFLNAFLHSGYQVSVTKPVEQAITVPVLVNYNKGVEPLIRY